MEGCDKITLNSKVMYLKPFVEVRYRKTGLGVLNTERAYVLCD